MSSPGASWGWEGIRHPATMRHIGEHTVIYNELRGRSYVVDGGMVQVNGRDGDGKARRRQQEVDFVCNRGSERIYLQSAYDIPDAEKLAQEQRPLDKIDDSFRQVIVVGRPIECHYGKTGVLILGLYDFLLDPASLELG